MPQQLSAQELDQELRARGVNALQRKRLIESARLSGIPNPLATLGYEERQEPLPGRRRSRSRSRRRSSEGAQALALPSPASSSAFAASSMPLMPGGSLPGQSSRLAAIVKKTRSALGTDEDDEVDVSSFLAGSRATSERMAKAKDRDTQQKIEQERANKQAREEAETAEKTRKDSERERQDEDKRKRDEEKRREERRRLRKEEKMRRRVQKKRENAAGQEECPDDDEIDSEAEEAEREKQRMAKNGFFKDAYAGNQSAKMVWSEKIKGCVSNNYKGTSDADLERRFPKVDDKGLSSSGQKLMTEEEVLALLRGSAKPK